MWHTRLMPNADDALKRLRKVATTREWLEAEEPAAIVAATEAGVPQSDIAQALGRTREHVRRIQRANGFY